MSNENLPSIEWIPENFLGKGKLTIWGKVGLALLGVQILARIVIHLREPFSLQVLAFEFATDPLIWMWSVLLYLGYEEPSTASHGLMIKCPHCGEIWPVVTPDIRSAALGYVWICPHCSNKSVKTSAPPRS